MDNEAFVRGRIRQGREDAGLSQRDMARLYGVSQSKISDIERGRVQVTATQLLEFSKLLGKPITYFFPSSTSHQLAELEAELLDVLRSLPPDWQDRLLSQARAEAKLYEIVRPYIRAGIPQELYSVMLTEEAYAMDTPGTVEIDGIPTTEQLETDHQKYLALLQRYARWKKEIGGQPQGADD